MRRYCQHLLQKLSNNGGVDAATEQIKAKQYAEPFKSALSFHIKCWIITFIRQKSTKID